MVNELYLFSIYTLYKCANIRQRKAFNERAQGPYEKLSVTKSKALIYHVSAKYQFTSRVLLLFT